MANNVTIDKYRLDDLFRETGEKGELARWVVELQTALDSERRKASALESELARVMALEHKPLAISGSQEQRQPDVMICDMCGHDAWLSDGGWYSCDGGHSSQVRSEPVGQRYRLPPHVYRELVNQLRDTAVKYAGCHQLRERIHKTLSEVVKPNHSVEAPEVKPDNQQYHFDRCRSCTEGARGGCGNCAYLKK